VTNDYIKTGSPIYARSFEIIREESNLARFPEDVEPVVVRMIHAAADPAIADLIAFTPGVAAAALKALEAGAPILCDSSMVATGIIRSRLPEHTRIVCHIKDPRLPAIAEAKGCTKTAAAVDLWQEDGLLDGAVVAIGNAPTALFRVLEVMHETGARPAAIVGIPVGFVGAAESKDALVADDSGVEYITVADRAARAVIRGNPGHQVVDNCAKSRFLPYRAGTRAAHFNAVVFRRVVACCEHGTWTIQNARGVVQFIRRSQPQIEDIQTLIRDAIRKRARQPRRGIAHVMANHHNVGVLAPHESPKGSAGFLHKLGVKSFSNYPPNIICLNDSFNRFTSAHDVGLSPCRFTMPCTTTRRV